MSRAQVRWLLILLFCFIGLAAQAVPVKIAPEQDKTGLGPGLNYWADFSLETGLDQALQKPFLAPGPYHAQFGEFGTNQKNTWARFTLHNPSDQELQRVFYLEDWAFKAKLWRQGPSGWELLAQKDFTEGPYPNAGTNFPYFHIELPPGISHWALMVQDRINRYREVSLYSPKAFERKLTAALASYALLMGILLVMGWYHTALYRGFRQPELFFFSAYIWSFCLLFLTRDQLLGAWFGLEPLLFLSHFPVGATAFVATFYFQLRYGFIMLGIGRERWALRWAMYVPLIGAALSLPLGYFDYELHSAILNNLPVFNILGLWVYALVFLVKNRQPGAAWLFFSITPAVGGGILEMLSLQTGENLIYHPWQWGIVAEVLILSGYMNRRIEQLRHEKEAAQAKLLADSKAHSAELETKVAQKTAALRKANETKDKFFSIVAHDLRGPVGSLSVLFNEVIQQPEQLTEELLQTVRRSTISTQQFLEELLSWARSQRGEIEFNPRPLAVAALFADTVELFAPQARAKGIVLGAEPPEQVWVRADAAMVRTILRNLTNNALKFTPAGGQVRLSCRIQEGEALVEVTDTGWGVPKSKQNSLFRLDVKAASSPGTRSEAGTGLGLILCKEFVERQAGHIGFKSQEGEGSRFWFTLPLSEQAPAQSAPERWAGLKVLVVEDNRMHQETTAKVLRDLNLKATYATDAEQAAAHLKAQEFDLILMDVDLPGFSGLEALSQFRQTGQRTPAAVLSSYAAAELKGIEEELDLAGLLNKPLELEALLELLERSLGEAAKS